MTKHNAENERIKRRYFAYLKEAMRHSEPTVDAAAKALNRFEEDTRHRNFKAFHFEQAIAFKRHLAEQMGQRSGEKLSKATQHATLKQLRTFFFWLAGQPGYKVRFQYSDANYFNMSDKDTRIATTPRYRRSPTLEQVRHVIETMPSGNEIECRDRALLAFALLTAARDSAIASMKLKHVDLGERCVHQDAVEVKTKFSKTLTTTFFPVGDGIQEIVTDWVRFLREEKLWGNDDPLFPATRVVIGQTHQFERGGLDRKNWSTATPIRMIFREAFERAGLPYFHPHSLRKTIAKLGEHVCSTPEHFKAWSQNMGHEQVLTTFLSYGSVAADRQSEIIKELGSARRSKQPDVEEIAEAVARRLKGQGAGFSTAQ
jgi:integrase